MRKEDLKAKVFGETLKEAIQIQGLTEDEFIDNVNMSKSTIKLILDGMVGPKALDLEKIFVALEMPEEEFFKIYDIKEKFKTFGEAIRYLRQLKELSVKDLSTITGYTEENINGLEESLYPIEGIVLERLLGALGISAKKWESMLSETNNSKSEGEPTHTYNTLGEMLLHRRELRSLNVATVAEITGISEEILLDIENDALKSIGYNTLIHLSKFIEDTHIKFIAYMLTYVKNIINIEDIVEGFKEGELLKCILEYSYISEENLLNATGFTKERLNAIEINYNIDREEITKILFILNIDSNVFYSFIKKDVAKIEFETTFESKQKVNSFSDILSRWVEISGLDIEVLALKTNLSLDYINSVIKGDFIPDRKDAVNIIKALSMSEEDFYAYGEIMDDDKENIKLMLIQNISKLVKCQRIYKGLSIESLTTEVEISKTKLLDFEEGNLGFSEEELEEIIRALDLTKESTLELSKRLDSIPYVELNIGYGIRSISQEKCILDRDIIKISGLTSERFVGILHKGQIANTGELMCVAGALEVTVKDLIGRAEEIKKNSEIEEEIPVSKQEETDKRKDITVKIYLSDKLKENGLIELYSSIYSILHHNLHNLRCSESAMLKSSEYFNNEEIAEVILVLDKAVNLQKTLSESLVTKDDLDYVVRNEDIDSIYSLEEFLNKSDNALRKFIQLCIQSDLESRVIPSIRDILKEYCNKALNLKINSHSNLSNLRYLKDMYYNTTMNILHMERLDVIRNYILYTKDLTKDLETIALESVKDCLSDRTHLTYELFTSRDFILRNYLEVKDNYKIAQIIANKVLSIEAFAKKEIKELGNA